MSEDMVRLFFPQWQGSGDSNDLYFSAIEIYDLHLKENEFISIDVSCYEGSDIKENILGFDAIVDNLERVADLLNRKRPRKIFSVGGDCGIELGPVSYLNKVYSGDMAVVWFDAHGDLNTPLSSPSKHFHGMVLRFLLEDGNEDVANYCFSHIVSSQVVLAGVRELDPAEEEYIMHDHIDIVSVDQMIHCEDIIVDLLSSKGLRNVYVHVDLDVLDPDVFPYSKCPANGGLSKQQLLKQLHKIDDRSNIVGFSIVEYLSTDSDGENEIRSLVDLCFRMK